MERQDSFDNEKDKHDCNEFIERSDIIACTSDEQSMTIPNSTLIEQQVKHLLGNNNQKIESNDTVVNHELYPLENLEMHEKGDKKMEKLNDDDDDECDDECDDDDKRDDEDGQNICHERDNDDDDGDSSNNGDSDGGHNNGDGNDSDHSKKDINVVSDENFSRYHLLVFITALIAFGFDAFDILIFTYASPICIPLLLGFESVESKEAQQQVSFWSGLLATLLLIGWGIGGIIFGYVTDRFGRTRTMILTVMIYSLGTGICALSFNIYFLAFFRFIAALGMGGEYAAGAGLIAEAVPNRFRVLGGALMSLGGNFGTVLSFVTYQIICVTLPIAPSLSWRLLFASALFPTIFALFLRIFLRESDKWKQEGMSERPSIISLFSRQHWKHTVGGVIMVSIALSTWYCISNFLPMIATHLATLQLEKRIITASELKPLINHYILIISISFNIGGICSIIFAAIPLSYYVSRLNTFRFYFGGAFLSVIVTFSIPMPDIVRLIMYIPIGFFCSGIFAIFTFYLPELFPTFLRGTGVGFTYNAGRFLISLFPLLFGFINKQGFNPLFISIWICVPYIFGFIFTFMRIPQETKHVTIS